METWYPDAQRDECPANLWGATFAPTRGVLHTTESKGQYRPAGNGTYFGHTSFPHFTVSAGRVWQHIPINRGARALLNQPGGVETNNAGAVQIEIDWAAADAANIPADTLAAAARLVAWISAEAGFSCTWTDKGAHDYPPEDGHRLGREPWRMSFDEWTRFRGWCGHCHVPENNHGDPGRLPIDRIFPQEDDMLTPQDLDAIRALVADEVKKATTPLWQQMAPRGGNPTLRDVVEQGLNAATAAAVKAGAASGASADAVVDEFARRLTEDPAS